MSTAILCLESFQTTFYGDEKMDEFKSIGKVTAETGISSRTLRYWEEAGLIKSTRDVQSGWRLYDEGTIHSIAVIEVLRRLGLSVGEIGTVLTGKSTDTLLRALRKQLQKLRDMTADVKLRAEVIADLIDTIQNEPSYDLSILEGLMLPGELKRKKNKLKTIEKGLTMENMKSKYGDIKFIQLPAMRTAAYSCVGIEPEDRASAPVLKWIRESGLEGTMRLFGFNTEPYPSEQSPEYGFGYCASIPEGVKIPEPLREMRLPGGVYMVISEYEGDPSFGWKKAQEVLGDADFEWEYDMSRHPGLEEHIARPDGGFIIPIVLPVKKK